MVSRHNLATHSEDGNQATTSEEDYNRQERFDVCNSDLLSVYTRGSVIIICNYEF
jgi:hypothetical protein